MDYKVIYRKYRPLDFENLYGQDYIKKSLQNTIFSSKISHAYIFSGPRGTGKTSTAKIFAKALNCVETKDGNPCGQCLPCTNFENNPDIIEIDAASNNGVDEIRELINNIKLVPSYSKYKVYIIDEVHMLSTSAFNALLLTLEEPPSHVVFILATTDVQNVPITVLSRCQRYDFRPISIPVLVECIIKVAKAENITITEEAAEEIAYISDGALRDAYSILDQLSDGLGNEINLENVINTFRTISYVTIQNLLLALEKNNVEVILNIMEDIDKSGLNIRVFIEKLMRALKDYAIKAKINPQKDSIEYDKIKNIIFDLNNCLNTNKSSISPYNLLVVVLLYYVTPQNQQPGKKVENDLSTEKNGDANVIDLEPEKQKQESVEKSEFSSNYNEKLIKTRINNTFVNADKKYLANIEDKWQKLIEYTKMADKKLFSIISETKIVVASDAYAIILANACNAKLINDSIDKLLDLFNEQNSLNYLMISLSEEQWDIEKNNYMLNKKNKMKYELIDDSNILMDTDESERLAHDLFGNKLEVN